LRKRSGEVDQRGGTGGRLRPGLPFEGLHAYNMKWVGGIKFVILEGSSRQVRPMTGGGAREVHAPREDEGNRKGERKLRGRRSGADEAEGDFLNARKTQKSPPEIL